MRFLVALLCVLCASNALAQLSGFKQDGEEWSFSEGSWSIHGILVKPEGNGPFPGILISHGGDGQVAVFGKAKADQFVKWGFVCIAVEYTYALGGSKDPRTRGSSPENIHRAMKTLEILRSLKYVDGARIAALATASVHF
jgi:dienelactone hydrolase